MQDGPPQLDDPRGDGLADDERRCTETGMPKPDDLDPELREIAGRLTAMHLAATEEVRRIKERRRRREFLRILPRIIIGCACFTLIGVAIGWVLIQVLKP